jgi:hypothetical protein
MRVLVIFQCANSNIFVSEIISNEVKIVCLDAYRFFIKKFSYKFECKGAGQQAVSFFINIILLGVRNKDIMPYKYKSMKPQEVVSNNSFTQCTDKIVWS